MRPSEKGIFVHLVWGTWDRLPLITPEMEQPLFQCLEAEAHRAGCSVLAVNGIPDHMHVLLEMPPTMALSAIMQQIKGSSSHFVNHALKPEHFFKWQGDYGAFSVSRWDIKRVAGYVLNQKEHHKMGNLMPDLETRTEALKSC